jgi:hypothetical protein
MFATSPYLLLGLVLALQAKHFICDGPLQTRAMVEGKRIYGNPMGVLHAAIHLVGTLVVLGGFGLPLWFVAAFGLSESVLHYHIDFTKERLVKGRRWTPTDREFWWALAADQGLHHATYLAMAAAAVALV